MQSDPPIRLRFALLIRVSTEKQANQGESLRTQETQLSEAIARIGGTIVAKYAGQEHATPGWERQQLQKLLNDAARSDKLFDAVMVADPSRWSRDNVSSEQGLALLRDSGVRFFVLSQEHNLYSDDARLFLALQSTIGSYQARVQTRKSLENRIHRAKRGIPASGSMPYGRTFDKATGTWAADQTAKALISTIAQRYLSGESLPGLAAEFGINESTLYDRLAKSGPELVTEFHSPNLNIHERVVINIPPLLDDQTIQAIRARATANTTYTHGQIKHQYLLSRMVYCGYCQSSMSGQYSQGQRYYRHLTKLDETCPFRGHVRAADLETAVMGHLFECFGNPVAVERAIHAALPNQKETAEHEASRLRCTQEFEAVTSSRERVLKLVVRGVITEDDAATQLSDLKERQRRLAEQIESIDARLGTIPSEASIKSTAHRVAVTLGRYRPVSAYPAISVKDANRDYLSMTWGEKRTLVELVFGGLSMAGVRLGVHVKPDPNQSRRWHYTVQGHLIDDFGCTNPDQASKLDEFDFGAAPAQKALIKTPFLVTTPGRSVPIPPRRCFPPCRSTHRAGE